MSQPQKHVPMRTCIATGEKRSKKELLRLVRLANPQNNEPEIQVDPLGKLRGRGANILPTLEAFEKALQTKAIERALKLERKLSAEEVSDLRLSFEKAISEKEFRQGRKPVRLKVSKEVFAEKVQG